MANVGDGIVVIGADGQVYAGNPAAQQMLGLVGPDLKFKLSAAPALQPLAQAYADWRADPARHTSFVTIKPYTDAALQGVAAAWSARRDLAAHLKVRFAAADTGATGIERSVIILQDVTGIENQAQQLKLASMGRLTASIAHEVRNPLSAIGHATALLGEDLDSAVHLRLLKIVGDNVARVNRMVEDILQLSRKVQPHGEPLALAGFLRELKAEFEETHGLPHDVIAGGRCRRRHACASTRCTCARCSSTCSTTRCATPAARRPASGWCWSADQRRRMELHVQDDGPGISTEVRAHLFEPFYTTSSKGTGLGLYLARELCLNNDAMLDYEYRFDAGARLDGTRPSSGRFVITFARLAAAVAPALA